MTRVIGTGRSADVYALDHGLVLRRYRDGHPAGPEALVMQHLHRLGFPVPRVHAVDGPDLIMERIEGRTLLAEMTDGDVPLTHAVQIMTGLQRLLHTLPPRSATDPEVRVLHMDLHPDNIIVGDRGPCVIDWCDSIEGPPVLDVAMSGLVIAEVAVQPELAMASTARELLDAYLSDVGPPPADVIAGAAGNRKRNPKLTSGERAVVDRAAELLLAARAST